MSIPYNLGIEKIKKDLNARGKQLSINDIDSCLAVSCFLHDLSYDFSTVIEDNDKADPFAEPTEQQFTELHRLFRSELRKKPYNYREKDFQQLYRQTIALSATLLRSCIVRAYNNGSIPGKK